jgi:peptidoglycan hydrolase-like protein with peptidoglycan-binding domain
MSTLYLYDDTVVSLIPSNATAVAGYVNGLYANLTALRARFPHAHILDIAVTASHDATCLDIETGDATNAQAVGWTKRQHARGLKYPILYTSAGNAQALINTLAANGIARSTYRLWSAHYTGRAHICGSDGYPKADGTQFTDKALGRSLDESLIDSSFFTTEAGTPYTPVLSQGMTGAEVETAQKRLNVWQPVVKSYALLTVDGNFGQLTRQAVIDFQTFMKISVDGEIGPQTLSYLNGDPQKAVGVPENLSHTAYETFTDFAWNPVPNAKEYDFQLVEVATGKQAYRKTFTGGHAEKIPTTANTKYYWRVAGLPGGSWSPQQTFYTPAPPTFPAPKVTVGPWIHRDISWGAVSLNGKAAESYTLQVLDVHGKVFAQTTVKGTSYSISVPKGEYEIRVWANGANVAPPHGSVTLSTT